MAAGLELLCLGGASTGVNSKPACGLLGSTSGFSRLGFTQIGSESWKICVDGTVPFLPAWAGTKMSPLQQLLFVAFLGGG